MIRRTLEMCSEESPRRRSFRGFSGMYGTSTSPIGVQQEGLEGEKYLSFLAISYSDQTEVFFAYTLGAPGRPKCIPTMHTLGEAMAATHVPTHTHRHTHTHTVPDQFPSSVLNGILLSVSPPG